MVMGEGWWEKRERWRVGGWELVREEVRGSMEREAEMMGVAVSSMAGKEKEKTRRAMLNVLCLGLRCSRCGDASRMTADSCAVTMEGGGYFSHERKHWSWH